MFIIPVTLVKLSNLLLIPFSPPYDIKFPKYLNVGLLTYSIILLSITILLLIRSVPLNAIVLVLFLEIISP